VFSSASAAALSHPHSRVAREIYSIWLNQFARCFRLRAAHKRGGRRKLWEKKSATPFVAVIRLYAALGRAPRATYYVTEPNDGAICQQIDTASGFYSNAFIDFFAEIFGYTYGKMR